MANFRFISVVRGQYESRFRVYSFQRIEIRRIIDFFPHLGTPGRIELPVYRAVNTTVNRFLYSCTRLIWLRRVICFVNIYCFLTVVVYVKSVLAP